MAYVYEGAKWGTSGTLGTAGGNVTYSFVAPGAYSEFGAQFGYSFTGMLNSTYQAVVDDAFDEWASYGDIDFSMSADSSSVDIRIGWGFIDGSGGTLAMTAYSYNPNGTMASVEIVFDTSETWAPTNAETGFGETSFEAVALHEIGHALGLDHYNGGPSIMSTYYGGSLVLTSNDIGGIQSIYGAAVVIETAFYYYAYNTASGDMYYGTVYDDGIYGYYNGYFDTANGVDDDGSGYWYYYVYGSQSLGDDYNLSGYNFVSYYYDGETGLSATPYYNSLGSASGYTGIGSEFDYVSFGAGGSDYFGYGYYEADFIQDTAYYYYAYNTASGDMYYGTVYDDGIYGYYNGYFDTANGVDDDGSGYWYYYVYGSQALGADYNLSGYNFASYYYDGETGLSATPYYNSQGSASGYTGLGSEFDYVSFGAGGSDYFGYGYYEADFIQDTAYYYYAYNTASGDMYYGTVYDDGSYGYYNGYFDTVYSGDDDGSGYWYYYVYGSQALGADYNLSGYNFAGYYYDGETGLSATPYYYGLGAASGYGGLGSEADYVTFGTGNYDLFGYGYYEADYH